MTQAIAVAGLSIIRYIRMSDPYFQWAHGFGGKKPLHLRLENK